jgi:hypothetical protein
MSDLRVLTVQQPWAWAILRGGKDIENRSQLWSYRGPLAIHAAGVWSQPGAVDRRVIDAFARSGAHPLDVEMVQRYGLDPLETAGFPRRAVLGVVELVDVHRSTGAPCCQPWGEGLHNGGRGIRLATHLVLADPKPFDEPIPWKGRLGLWRPDDVLAGEIGRQLAGGAW